MTEKLPVYPVYIPSKGRPDSITARCLRKDGVPFRLVVEPQEVERYAASWGEDSLLVLPFSNLGQGSIPARNWIKDHATAEGHERHWQLDDNIRDFYRLYRGKRVPCAAGIALRVCEVLTDRYSNVAISGLNYTMFGMIAKKPFWTNCHVYSASLILNAIPHRWRGRYNEDTDICLQVLSDGWCTILVNAFQANKMRTLTMKGGNSDELYDGDGRLKMARSLERVWPGVVTVDRRFGRPQHVIANGWKNFDTPLKLKDGLTLEGLASDEFGMKLVVKEQPKSPRVQKLIDGHGT